MCDDEDIFTRFYVLCDGLLPQGLESFYDVGEAFAVGELSAGDVTVLWVVCWVGLVGGVQGWWRDCQAGPPLGYYFLSMFLRHLNLTKSLQNIHNFIPATLHNVSH